MKRTLLAGIFISLAFIGQIASNTSDALPPLPFEHVGACPFECCVYRDWIATRNVPILSHRDAQAPAAFTVQRSERVDAIGGIVVTEKPGRLTALKRVDLDESTGEHWVENGDVVYVLHYLGEGYSAVWHRGKLFEYSVPSLQDQEACHLDPHLHQCGNREFHVDTDPRAIWWVQIRVKDGRIGWTNRPEWFSNKDECG